MSPQAGLLAFDRTHLTAGSRICVAVSGGADSVALLRALDAANRLPREALGVGLGAVHVHHGLRGEEADGDAAFVEDLCGRLGVRLHLHRVDVAAQVESAGETMEEASRNLRYGVFHRLLAGGETDAIATAHTLDDQAETVLMKLLRGAWLEGLGGIHPVLAPAEAPGKRILRPLLGTSRAEVVGYLQGLGQDWREDCTNTDMAHTRNRMRHQILPLLRTENPSLDRTLTNLAELAREEEARWQAEMRRLLPQLLLPGKPVRGGGRAVGTALGEASVAMEIERLRGLDAPARRRVLRGAVRSLGNGAPRLSFDETNRLLALCGQRVDATVASKPGSGLRLGGGLRAERSVRELRLTLDSGRE